MSSHLFSGHCHYNPQFFEAQQLLTEYSLMLLQTLKLSCVCMFLYGSFMIVPTILNHKGSRYSMKADYLDHFS